jgi:hypothetical protein
MSFILLAHWNGRFGNRMHQYAYGATYSKITGSKFILPSDWEGTKLFKTQYHQVLDNDELRLNLNQSSDYFHTYEVRHENLKQVYPKIKQINPEDQKENYKKYNNPVYFDSVCAYGNSVYSKMSVSFLKEVFEFSDLVKNTEAYKYWESKKGTYDIAHLRRDDISNPNYNLNRTQGYSVISKESYFKAFEKFGFNKNEIIWISDDYTNKWHEDRPKTEHFGWEYPIGSEYRDPLVFDWLEDFLKLYFARTVFRANSSFSWWACFLSPTAKVYSPVIDKRIIYGVDALKEIGVDFVSGNHPHWMYNEYETKHIIIDDWGKE